MSGTNGHRRPGTDAAVAATRPIMLVRYRPGVTGETARTVHIVPLPTNGQTGAVSAACGAVLILTDIETVTPSQGMPCTMCVLNHVTGTTQAVEPLTNDPNNADPGLPASAVAYHNWDWPVTHHRDQIWLCLRDIPALVIPIPLCTEVTQILTARRCTPPVLAHPYTPEHHIVLTGERYGVPLPWPRQVHQVTDVLPLPPTVTPHGPITWTQPPQQNSLQLCREIDLFGALRTALNDLPPHDRPIPSPPDKYDR